MLVKSSVLFFIELPLRHYWVSFEQETTDWYSVNSTEAAILPGFYGKGMTWSSSSSSVTAAVGDFSFDCLGSWGICSRGITFSVWLKPFEHTGPHAYLGFGDDRFRIDLVYYDNHPSVSASDKSWVILTDNGIQTAYPFNIQLNVWSQVAVSVNVSNRLLLFSVNGIKQKAQMVKIGQNGTSNGTLHNPYKIRATLHFGKATGVNQTILYNYQGSIDEFRIFDRPTNESWLFRIYCKYKNHFNFLMIIDNSLMLM